VIKSHVLYQLSYALTWRIKYLNSAGFTSLARFFVPISPYALDGPGRRGLLYLLDVYAKSAKEDLTDAEKREIRNLIAALEAEG
jgi:hypothetical protein